MARALAITAGLILIGVTFLVDAVLNGPGLPNSLGVTLVVCGCVFIALSVLARQSALRTALAKISITVISLFILLSLAEVAFRIVGFNFDTPNRAIPIFNQPPSLHTGNGILRRPGPASWRGRPLSSFINHFFGIKNAYPEEKEIEVRYDRQGFRNPLDLTDWDVVVTGDSFVESGYLAYEDMFTSIAANRLGVQLKNLGVSGTGPIFQTAYLRNYGKAPSTRHAVLCFFDGNDVSDLIREVHDTNYILQTGHRLGRQKQTSLLIAFHDQLRRLRHLGNPRGTNTLKVDAVFVATNREYLAAVWRVAPPRWDDLKKDRQELVAAALTNWAVTVRSLGMKPWVMCIPDNRRVFHGHLHYSDTNHPIARWRSAEFGPHLAQICANLDIPFIDTFPALRREVEAGRVPYNLFGDVHLSAQGSQVVADVLANALRPELESMKGRRGAKD